MLNPDRSEKQKSQVFVAETLYHLYLSILLSFQYKESLLVLTNFTACMKQFTSKIKQENIFNDVVYLEFFGKIREAYDSNSFVKKTFRRKGCIRSAYEQNSPIYDYFDLIDKSDINLFLNLGSTPAYFVNTFKKNTIRMIEDGERNYVSRLGPIKIFKRKYLYKSFIGEGRDPEIKEIHVQEPERLPEIIREKGRKLDLQSLRQSITGEQSKMLMRIFSLDEFQSSNFSNGTLLITQPISEDKFVSEERKLDLYQGIIQKYAKDDPLFIKVHPREKTDYSKFFGNDAHIISKDFPIELFDLIPGIQFEKGITLFSGAIKNLNCVKHKIFLGNDYAPGLQHKKVHF